MTLIAKYIILLFAVFLIGVGLLMCFKPIKARAYLRQAASTNLINYLEITIRLIPATALVLYAEHAKAPNLFTYLGGFMIITSLVLYLVPRRLHHSYALLCADWLNPSRIRALSPLSIVFGAGLLYAVL
ncbi:hypothetical protein ACFO5O_01245 [Geojedonia litorea]|uniref:Uncharacterized protein n=1 Tax=Geojedonia litorea TaxID=1268269 RepID=A0ABV9N068_9FLAO